MEDEEVKRRLAKVPDVDKDGEPIWKIESPAERVEKRNREDVPLFLKRHSSSDKGNPQDEKDETPE
jgi:hypothetical protein